MHSSRDQRGRAPRSSRTRGRRAARSTTLTMLAALVPLVSACLPGQYPNDNFPEMHYQPSQRRLEPERRTVPAGAVPITGERPNYTYPQAASLHNPVVLTQDTYARAASTYHVNCAMCHGATGHGDGPVAPYFQRAATVPVPNLASQLVQSRTDGQLYWIITYGMGNMPPYHNLLSEQDTWTLVAYLRTLR